MHYDYMKFNYILTKCVFSEMIINLQLTLKFRISALIDQNYQCNTVMNKTKLYKSKKIQCFINKNFHKLCAETKI